MALRQGDKKRKENMTRQVVAFDICGTLFKSNTTFDFLEYFLCPINNRYRLYNHLRKTFAWRLLNKVSRKGFHKDITRIIALRFLKGYQRNELLTAARDFYDNFLMQHVNEEVVRQYTLLQEKQNADIIIASATIDVVAEIIAQKLHCEHWYSSRLLFENDSCCGYLDIDLLGSKKEKVFDGQDVDIKAFYTDDFSDVPVLEMAEKKNIIVYPKTKNQWQKIIKNKRWDARCIEC